MIPQNKINAEKETIFKNCQCQIGSCLECQKKGSRIDKYATSEVPVQYWDLSFKDFKGDQKFAEKFRGYLGGVKNVYNEGKSLILVGTLGVGKTYSVCCLLKIAIVNDYTAYYTTMADIISNAIKEGGSDYLARLLSVDFLVIDELDPRWIFPSEKSEQLFGSTMEHLLRTRFQNKLPTIMCSNADDVDKIFAGAFARTFKSLRSYHTDILYVSGVDHRRKAC